MELHELGMDGSRIASPFEKFAGEKHLGGAERSALGGAIAGLFGIER
jgi:hypothetical protein